jgi:hypothetical protein
LVRSTQKETSGAGLNYNVADFIPENYHDDEHSNSTRALEKPAGEYKPACLGKGVTQPKQ